jgi:Tfp pilus assembly protein PilO
MTQKTKNRLLLLAFLVILTIAYQLAFSKTFALRNEVNILRKQSDSFEGLANFSANLQQQEKFADSVLLNNNVKNISVQNNLLQYLNQSSIDKGFNISSFQEPHMILENGVNTTSYQFTIQGNFNDLLYTIYELEQNFNFGKIASLNFERKRDYRQGKDYLICFVVVESLISE